MSSSPEAFTDMPRTVARAWREWQLLQDRQQAQEALRLSNQRLDLLAESPAGFWPARRPRKW